MALVFEKYAFLKRLAESIEMSFDIPDAEKDIATEALIRFEATNKSLGEAVEHLDIIYAPFKRHENISTKAVVKRRGVLNRFKQASIRKFNKFKKRAFLAMRRLDYFSKGDRDIQELISSFESAIGELEDGLQDFYDALSNYEAPEFRDDVLASVESVRKAHESLETLISDRIIEHIDTDILAKSWMSDKRDEFDYKDEERKALITQLFEERQKMLDPSSFPGSNKQQQALNPSDAPRAYHPDHARVMNIGVFGE